MKLASGVAPVPQMLMKDLPVGLGTDGAASNNDLDLWEEMDTAAKLHKVFSGDPKVVTAEQAFEMATIRRRAGAASGKYYRFARSRKTRRYRDRRFRRASSNALLQRLFQSRLRDQSVRCSHCYHQRQNRDAATEVCSRSNESAIKKDANLYRQKIIKSLSSQ